MATALACQSRLQVSAQTYICVSSYSLLASAEYYASGMQHQVRASLPLHGARMLCNVCTSPGCRSVGNAFAALLFDTLLIWAPLDGGSLAFLRRDTAEPYLHHQ